MNKDFKRLDSITRQHSNDQARQELQEMMEQTESVSLVADWINKYLLALGYKALVKMLVEEIEDKQR